MNAIKRVKALLRLQTALGKQRHMECSSRYRPALYSVDSGDAGFVNIIPSDYTPNDRVEFNQPPHNWGTNERA